MTKLRSLGGQSKGRYRWTDLLRFATAPAVLSRLLARQCSATRQLTFNEFAAEVFNQLHDIPEHRAVKDPAATLDRIAKPLARMTPPTPPLVPAEVNLIINELPDVTRAVLSLHLRRDLHFRQIGEILGMPPDVALAHLREALAYLRKHLLDNGR
jgi:DNA-directed RNA polymerase specialized sigma24 family protein